MKILSEIGYIKTGPKNISKMCSIHVCISITEDVRIYIAKNLSAATLKFEKASISWSSSYVNLTNVEVTEFASGLVRAVRVANMLDRKYI